MDKKNEEEWQLMRYFLRAFPAFPKGKLDKSESPDFILQLSRHRQVGIEMTRAFLSKAKDDLHFVPHKGSKQAAFLNEVKSFFIADSPVALFGHFVFNEHFDRFEESHSFMAELLASWLNDRLSGYNGNRHWHINFKKDLPFYLDEINLVHGPNDAHTDFVACEYRIPIENYLDSLHLAIGQKEEKMTIYQKNRFDEYWLLIVADCLNCATPFNMYKMLEKWDFSSAFHRVFLFELYEMKVHEL